MIDKIIDSVFLFNRLICEPGQQATEDQIPIILSEMDELELAVSTLDYQEVVDGVGDVAVTMIGLVYRAGLSINNSPEIPDPYSRIREKLGDGNYAAAFKAFLHWYAVTAIIYPDLNILKNTLVICENNMLKFSEQPIYHPEYECREKNGFYGLYDTNNKLRKPEWWFPPQLDYKPCDLTGVLN